MKRTIEKINYDVTNSSSTFESMLRPEFSLITTDKLGDLTVKLYEVSSENFEDKIALKIDSEGVVGNKMILFKDMFDASIYMNGILMLKSISDIKEEIIKVKNMEE